MTRVIAHPSEPLDEHRHARQRPQLRGEPMTARSAEQRQFQARQLPAIQPGFPSQPPRGLQARSALLMPRVIPPMRRLPTDLERPHDRRLRLSAPKQLGGFEAARFQRSNIPSLAAWIGHAPGSDGSR